jgi:hypothetical protein
VLELTLCDKEYVPSSGKRREYSSYADVLVVGQDAFSAVMGTFVNEVVGVPTGPVGAHLGEPRLDVAGRATNGDGVIDRADRQGNQIVPGKCPDAFFRGSADLHASANGEYRDRCQCA